MKKLLLCAVLLISTNWVFAQDQNFWTSANKTKNTDVEVKNAKKMSQQADYRIFKLEIKGLKAALAKAPTRGKLKGKQSSTISFPTANGDIESFNVVEASVLHPDLAAKYPGIKSYAGQGIEDPSATIRFSISNERGFHGMILSAEKGTYYIDPYSLKKSSYMVYFRKDLKAKNDGWQCLTDAGLPSVEDVGPRHKATNDGNLRRYRLALSCTAEYGNIFAGIGTDAQKKARILAQMNITMTRVNGIYERDLAIILEIVPNNDLIIYHGLTTSDPWGDSWDRLQMAAQQAIIQSTIDNTIGAANYDIGHNFNTSGGGSAGCIGCVCTNGTKGRGFTGRANPTGDAFDIDYVAHEMGHQFGGYHTMNTCSRSGNGTTEVEPASGSSIMGYAGICATNIQANSDAYFAYVNIRDISANVQTGVSSGCAQLINLANNAPNANAGNDYIIPKSTAFALTGVGNDIDVNDNLTYCWEQNDPTRAPGNGSPASNWAVGPLFRSKAATDSPTRYFPQISDVVANNLAPTWEVIPSVARTMNFSLTVRDNHAGGGQTDDDLMTVTVNGVAGPFLVTAPNTNVNWNAGEIQTVTWDIAGTNIAPVNCANVDILLSTDGGYTYPITILENTPNDGSQNITVPNNQSTTCRIKLKANGNIFYDISNTNFTILGGVVGNATTPVGLASSAIGTTNARLSWNLVQGTSYDYRYRIAGTLNWTTVQTNSNSVDITGLTAQTEYEAQVRSKLPNSNSAYSASINFTTTGEVVVAYCAANGNDSSEEYISRVELGTIDNVTDAGAGGYADYYNSVSTDLNKGIPLTITITPTWPGRKFNEAYGVWIDYNQDGDFTDAGEQVWSKTASQDATVSGSFTVPASALNGETRMRVILRYSTAPLPCDPFNYGEVEDYKVNILGGANVAEAALGKVVYANEKTRIYPNPVQNKLHVKVNKGTLETVEIYNLQGSKIDINIDNNDIVDVSGLMPGIYFITVKTELNTITERFIKK